MKLKILLPIICSILIGFLFGKIIFNKYDSNAINAFVEKDIVYFIEIGVFEDEKAAIDNFSNSYLIIKEDNSFHVYGGITKNTKTRDKLKDYYLKNTNNINVYERVIDNEQFTTILEQYDKITMIATKDEDLLEIEKIVMSNYKEMVLQT